MIEGSASLGERIAPLLPRLRRFARALTRHPQDADDLVQLAVERALARRESWRPESDPCHWLMAIMRNAWIDERRSRARRNLVLVNDEEAVDVGDSGTDGEIELWSIQSALTKLPDEQQWAVALVLVEGLAYREAAEILQIPIGTLMSRLSRARATLQRILTDDRGGGRESIQ